MCPRMRRIPIRRKRSRPTCWELAWAIFEDPAVQRFYVGPKSLSVLESVAVPTLTGAPQDLRALVNFGFFGVIARPLFLWLKWTYEMGTITGAGRSSSRP